MSERVLAIIRIGGQLDASGAEVLIDAINMTHVFAHEGDTYFEPRSVEDLVAAVNDDGHLQLTDDSAPYGEMLDLTAACHEFGLSYRLWHEVVSELGSTVELWAPGMDQPVCYPSDHLDHGRIFVDAAAIGAALELLRAGKADDAITLLEGALPTVPNIPPFEVVEDTITSGVETAIVAAGAASQ